jgi:hypothetical protein
MTSPNRVTEVHRAAAAQEREVLTKAKARSGTKKEETTSMLAQAAVQKAARKPEAVTKERDLSGIKIKKERIVAQAAAAKAVLMPEVDTKAKDLLKVPAVMKAVLMPELVTKAKDLLRVLAAAVKAVLTLVLVTKAKDLSRIKIAQKDLQVQAALMKAVRNLAQASKESVHLQTSQENTQLEARETSLRQKAAAI